MKIHTTNKIFFPNLDGLRYIAFFAVFIHHTIIVDCFVANKQSSMYSFINAIKQNGALGVNLFFVLSGFLITYLLLSEKKKNNTIDVPKFYMRRLLRIWPLYFLTVFIGFFVFAFIKKLMAMPNLETHSITPYLLFISNFEILAKSNADSSILNVLWSVGIEEQFYIVWPLLILLIPQRFLPFSFLVYLVGVLLFRFFNVANWYVIYYHTLSVTGDMAIGGLAAWLVFYNTKFLNSITNLSRVSIISIYCMGLSIILFNYLIFTSPAFIVVERLIYSLFFGFVILEQNFSKNSFYKMSKFSFLSKWGNYTYGLYCIHSIALLIVHLAITKVAKVENNWIIMLCYLTLGLALTKIMAYYSYHYFEKPFLKYKNKFSFFTKGD
jgi:peptidoglycan/LPS O-acetylase OafA/YrhL